MEVFRSRPHTEKASKFIANLLALIRYMVEVKGIEPSTSALRTQRSPI